MPVRVDRRQRQPRKKIRIGVGGAFTVDKGVTEGGEELEPTLHASVVFAHLDDALQSLVIRKNRRCVCEKQTRRRFIALTILATSKSNTVQLRSASSVARFTNGMGRTPLSACSCTSAAPKPIDTGATSNPERGAAIRDSVPIRKSQNRRFRQFRQRFLIVSAMSGVKQNMASLCKRSVRPLTRTARPLVNL